MSTGTYYSLTYAANNVPALAALIHWLLRSSELPLLSTT